MHSGHSFLCLLLMNNQIAFSLSSYCRVSESQQIFPSDALSQSVSFRIERKTSVMGRSLHLILIALLKHCKTVKKPSGTKIKVAVFSVLMKILMVFYSTAMIACLGKLNFMQLHKSVMLFFFPCPVSFHGFNSSEVWVWKHIKFKFLSLKPLLHECGKPSLPAGCSPLAW